MFSVQNRPADHLVQCSTGVSYFPFQHSKKKQGVDRALRYASRMHSSHAMPDKVDIVKAHTDKVDIVKAYPFHVYSRPHAIALNRESALHEDERVACII